MLFYIFVCFFHIRAGSTLRASLRDGETCLTWERNDYVAGAFDISLNAVADKIRESLFATCWRLGPTTLAAS
jgi:hypothetical protein